MLSSGRQLVSASGEVAADALPAFSPPSAEPHWQHVHHLLTRLTEQASLLPEVLGLATYHYGVYKAFGQAAAASLAQRLLQQAATQVAGANKAAGQPYSATWLEQACAAAWLSARLTAEGLPPTAMPALLASLDTTLLAHALNRNPPPTRQVFSQVVRYFTLRLADATTDAAAFLTPLLTARLPLTPWATSAAAPPAQVPLGLEYGLVAELRGLISLHQAGIRTGDPLAQLRQGIRYLLTKRQEADFLTQKYSIFPSHLPAPGSSASYGAALSWPHGDLGPALLLYESHKILNDSELSDIAELIGLNTLLRTTVPATEVASARFAQGAAGTAHLYHKLHLVSGQPAYAQGQQFWLSRTQALLQQELAAGSYDQGENSLRYGLAGIGLVLLSAVTKNVINWDNYIL